jgi:O-antigen/teichoic acid export membrane protein
MNANLDGTALKPSGSSGFRRLLSNASSMVGSAALNSGLGFVYQVWAAQLYSKAIFGFSSALVSLMIALASVAMLGFGNTLIGELPNMQRDRGRLVSAALIANGVFGVLIGLIAVILAPMLSKEFAPLRDNLWLGLLFACGVALSGIGTVLDEALIGMLRGKLQLWRNALFAVLKLGLLLALGFSSFQAAGNVTLFASWVLGLAAAFVLLAWTMRAQRINVLPSPDFSRLWAARRVALGHHAINLAYLGTGNILPLIVIASFGAETNASFYVAWMLTGFGFVVPHAFSTVLQAMSTADTNALATRLRSSLGVSSLIVIGYGLLLFFGAHLILGVFGKSYAVQAETSLQILAFALLPVVVKTHYMTLGRIRNQLAHIARYAALGTVLELILAVIGAQVAGLSGLCAGYVIALYLEAIYAGRNVYMTAFPNLNPGSSATDASGVQP